MKRLLALLVACAIWLPLQAFGEVMHYSRCTLVEGKTIEDVQTWLNDWRALVQAKGVDYRARILLPHADGQLAPDEFYIEGGSSTLQSYAAAWDWWYTDADALKSADQLSAAALCKSGTLYRSTD